MATLGTFDLGQVAQSVGGYLGQGVLGRRVNDIHSFVNKVASKLSPTRIIGNRMGKENQLQKFNTRPDPLMTHEWIAMVLPHRVSSDMIIPWHYIDTIDMPELTIEAMSQKRNGKAVHYASFPAINTFQMGVYADTAGESFNMVNYWLRSTYRNDKYFGLPRDYKRSVQVYVYDPTRKVVVDFLIKGCFITSANNPKLDATAGVQTHDLTLSCDDIFVNYESDLSAIKTSVDRFVDAGSRTLGDAVFEAGSSVFQSVKGVFAGNTSSNGSIPYSP